MTIPACYCRDCKLYYITESVYELLKEHGRPLCQLMSQNEYDTLIRNKNYAELASKSLLNLIGYTVNKKDDLTAHQRHTILQYAIEAELMGKSSIISFLKWNIRRGEGKDNVDDAIEKWREDIEFLTGYKSGSVRMVGIDYLVK